MISSGRQVRFLQSLQRISSSPISRTTSSPFTRTVSLPHSSSTFLKSRYLSSFARFQQQATAFAHDDGVASAPAQAQEFTKFAELGQHGIIDSQIVKTITEQMKIHTMTEVQRMTLNECLDGTDVIAQARTGTGKTLAFLLPIVQRILRDPKMKANAQAGNRYNRGELDIRALIISPTRELAEQIAVEAKKLTWGTNLKVQTAVGGTGKRYHLNLMQNAGCHILVGTPGRVNDLLSDPSTGIKLDNIETFVLDEADRLLDIGFQPAIEEIQSYMPKRADRDRQTLMFSATVPKSVVSLVRQVLRPDFKFVRTVDPDEAPTHANVPQKVAFLRGLENQIPAILEIATQAMAAHKADPANHLPFKAIVYFSSLNEVALATEIFQNLREPAISSKSNIVASHPIAPCKIMQMSSKLSQEQRTRNSQTFRDSEQAILLSSDVTARGMDFPNVSHVIQVGLPRGADDYVHRLGRTGRAGKSGEGWLLLNDDERYEYQKRLYHNGIKIDEDKTLLTPSLDMTQGAQIPASTARLMQIVEGGVRATPYDMKHSAFISLLGVLQQQNPVRPKQSIIDLLNRLARFGWGLEKSPGVSPTLISKLGFQNCRGIEVSESSGYGRQDRNSPQGRGGYRRDSFDEKDPFGFGGSGRGSFQQNNREGGGRGSYGSGRNFDDRRSGFDNDRRGGRSSNDLSSRGFGGRDFGSRGGRSRSDPFAE